MSFLPWNEMKKKERFGVEHLKDYSKSVIFNLLAIIFSIYIF